MRWPTFIQSHSRVARHVVPAILPAFNEAIAARPPPFKVKSWH